MKRFITGTIAVLMTAVMFVSCASTGEAPVDETEVISVEPAAEQAVVEETADDETRGGWLNALGSIEGLDVKSFRLRGEGPDGASFGWIDVKGTKVALSDIRRGEWDLYAQAIGENGDVVAKGHLKTFLSDSTPLGTLFLSEEDGSGDVDCNFAWTTTQVLYPTIEIYMKTEDGEFMARPTEEIVLDKNGHATWTAKNVPAGSYIVRAILKDEGEVVSGVAAALRVVDGKVSVGDCRFVIGKLSTVYGIDLQEAPLDTVTGEIVLTDGSLSFTSERANLKYSWFLDGTLMTELKDESVVDVTSLELKKGFYRFDCIAYDANGFSSINTDTAFIYIDGDGNIATVTEEQADSQKGDVPEGYMEITTVDSEEYSAGVTFIKEDTAVETEPVVEATVETEVVAEETPVVEEPVVEEDVVVVETTPEAPEIEVVETDVVVVENN